MIIQSPEKDNRTISIRDGDNYIRAEFKNGKCRLTAEEGKVLLDKVPSLKEIKPKKKQSQEDDD